MTDPEKIGIVSHSAIALCALLYIAVGACGYLAFLTCTAEDILSNLSNFWFLETVRVALGLGLAFTFPILLFEARHILEG